MSKQNPFNIQIAEISDSDKLARKSPTIKFELLLGVHVNSSDQKPRVRVSSGQDLRNPNNYALEWLELK